MLHRFDLKNKVILLTGGAGIYGRGLTADLAAANATLIIASRNQEASEVVAAEERQAGRSVVAETLDQSNEESILALRDRIKERFGHLDGLVNNAVARPMSSPEESTAEWEESLRVNATGIYLMHRHFGKLLGENPTSSIVNIGSIYGMVGPTLSLYEGIDMSAGAPDYYFNKGGMVNLTRYYAAHFGANNVRVNCLSPGGFFNNQPDEFVQRYNSQTFLKRMGNASDLGGSVVFLLSDASQYVTGVNLPVDGGFTAH
jgi:NAD(P)-dependent dehydrogenase (short-subunit alcohol dehydrogenase family)